MTAASDIYANALVQAYAGNVDLGSDTLKMGLLSSAYTPNLTGHVHWSDVSGDEIAGTGYSPGGVTLSSESLTLTAANSWSHTWAAGHVYNYGDIVRPGTGNGFLYRAVQAGTSGGSQPTFPTTVGETVGDSGVVWACIGYAVIVFTTAQAAWSGATFTTSYGVIYDSTSGVLLVLETFDGAQAPVSQPFDVTPDPINGWYVHPVT